MGPTTDSQSRHPLILREELYLWDPSSPSRPSWGAWSIGRSATRQGCGVRASSKHYTEALLPVIVELRGDAYRLVEDIGDKAAAAEEDRALRHFVRRQQRVIPAARNFWPRGKDPVAIAMIQCSIYSYLVV